MKNIPLTDATAGTTMPGSARSGRAAPMKSPGSDAGSPYAAAAEKEKNWIKLLSKMLEDWNNRFKSAALAQKRAARLQQKVIESPPTRVDEFELPQDAKILAAYQLNWPEKAPADMGKVKLATLKIQYFQLLQENTLKKSLTDMKKMVKWGDAHLIPNGFWLETIKNGSQPNTKRSIDVFVTFVNSPNGTQPPVEFAQKEEPTDLQIDILAIEIADPATFKE
jgi:hypothetical protein